MIAFKMGGSNNLHGVEFKEVSQKWGRGLDHLTTPPLPPDLPLNRLLIYCYCYNIDFNEESTSSDQDDGTVVLQFTASSYPELRFLWWRKGTGENVSSSHYNITRHSNTFHSTLLSYLTVNSIEECGLSRGYILSVFREDERADIVFHCPPGMIIWHAFTVMT